MAKTAKEYAEILKTLFQMEISELEDEMEEVEEEERYFTRGMINGYKAALDKINASEFLVED